MASSPLTAESIRHLANEWSPAALLTFLDESGRSKKYRAKVLNQHQMYDYLASIDKARWNQLMDSYELAVSQLEVKYFTNNA